MQEDCLDVLVEAARHDVLVGEQIRVALSVDPVTIDDVLARHVARGLLRSARWFPSVPSVYWITEMGLEAVGSELPPPVVSVADVRRGLGATWAYVRAADGRILGATALTRREAVARDRAPVASRASRPVGVRVAGLPAEGGSGLSYPDVVLVWPDALAAIHVWLTGAGLGGLPAWLRAYGADARYQVVAFLVEDERLASRIEAVAASLGLQRLVSVQWMEFPV